MRSEMSESKRVALIAGASGGIGGETARTMAREGYDLALCYRSNDEAAGKVAGEVEGLGATARTYKATLHENAEVEAVVEQVVADFGKLDATIYAAGPY